MKICIRCGEPRKITEFQLRSIPSGKRRNICIYCNRIYATNFAKELRRKAKLDGVKTGSSISRKKTRLIHQKKIFEFFKTHPCVDCGESNPLRLTFDHVRGKKLFTIANKISQYKWETIEEEIKKCDVRCANCHSSRTMQQNGCVTWFFEEYGEKAMKPWSKYEYQPQLLGSPYTIASTEGI